MKRSEAEKLLDPDLREDLSAASRRKLPKIFRERHEKAYMLYLGMGENRSHNAVAEKMGLTAATISNWAAAYRWTERLKSDLANKKLEGLIEYFGDIASIREDGIRVVRTLMSILNEITIIISEALKTKRALNAEEQGAVDACRGYLNSIGIKVTNGRELKDLIVSLGEIIDFRPGSGGVMKEEETSGKTNINVPGGSVLIIQGLRGPDAKEVLNEMPTPLLRGPDPNNSPLG